MGSPAGAIRAGGAYIEFFVHDAVTRQLSQLGKKFKSAGASLTNIGARLAGGAAAVSAPFLGAIKAASDLEETMNKFGVVFGDQAGAVKAWGDEFAGQVGRSKKQVADFLAGTQDLLVPLGFEDEAATAMSKQITGLAVDLASFNNMADDDALRDLHAALTGSGEVMKKYGVVLSEAAVKQELLNNSIDPATATNQQKAQARLNIILAGTTAAQGDAIRSAGSFANQMKALKGNISDAAAELGTHLLPVVTPLVTKAAAIVQVLGTWIASNKKLVMTAAAIIGVVGAAGVAIAGIGVVLSAVGAGFTALATLAGTAFSVIAGIIGAVLSPIGLVVAAVVGLTAAWATMTQSGQETISGLLLWFGQLKDYATETWKGIAAALKAGDLKLAARIAWIELQLIWQRGVDYLGDIWQDFTNLAITTFDNVITWIRKAWTKLSGWLGQQIAKVIAFFTGEDADQMASIVADMTKADVKRLEDEKMARFAAREKEKRDREAANKQQLDDLKRERDEALSQAAAIAKQQSTEAPALAGQPAQAQAIEATAQAAISKAKLDSTEFGLAAFAKFDEARRGLEEKMAGHLASIDRQMRGGVTIATEG